MGYTLYQVLASPTRYASLTFGVAEFRIAPGPGIDDAQCTRPAAGDRTWEAV
jgi:hypothetical protein